MYISKKQAKCFILLMPIFCPIYLDYITASIHFYSILQYIAYIYIIIGLIKTKKRISIVTLLAIIMQSWILISTILGNGYLDEATSLFLRITYPFLLFDFYRDQFKLLLKQLMLHSELCIYINLFTLLIAPNGFLSRSNIAYGMTQEWFLGADAYFIMWILPALIIAWAYAYIFKRKRKAIMISLAAIITEIVRGSGTGIIVLSLFFIVLIIPIIKKILTPYRSVLIGVIAFLCIIFLREFDLIVPILNLLEKDITFTGRITIWDNAINCIINNPIFGYGILTNDAMVQYLGKSSTGIWVGATHCHSQLLQTAFQGGIVAALLLFCIIGVVTCKSARIWPNKLSNLSGLAIALYIIMSITEVFSFPIMYMIFPLINLICDWKIDCTLELKRERLNNERI